MTISNFQQEISFLKAFTSNLDRKYRKSLIFWIFFLQIGDFWLENYKKIQYVY